MIPFTTPRNNNTNPNMGQLKDWAGIPIIFLVSVIAYCFYLTLMANEKYNYTCKLLVSAIIICLYMVSISWVCFLYVCYVDKASGISSNLVKFSRIIVHLLPYIIFICCLNVNVLATLGALLIACIISIICTVVIVLCRHSQVEQIQSCTFMSETSDVDDPVTSEEEDILHADYIQYTQPVHFI
jgi:hypothetical protein